MGVAKNPNARFPISLASECEMSPMLKSIEYRKSRAMKPYYIDILLLYVDNNAI